MKIEARKLLEKIAACNGGLLRPEDVLKEARKVKSPLHGEFPEDAWSDKKAARQYRLQCARDVITRVKIEIIPAEGAIPVLVRAYTSLASDRLEGGGYRPTVAVLDDATQRAEMVRTAWQELQALRRKYAHLSELVAVFDQLEQPTSKTGTG